MKKHLQHISFLILIITVTTTGYAMVWNQKADFSGNRYGAFGFAIGQYGYVGGGVIDAPSGLTLVNDLWAYDVVTDQWTQKVSMPGTGLTSAAAFALNGKG